ncbi:MULTISPECIES: heavy metal translocating P-type ATPase [Mogibacterium]|uniref:Cd(2+)-exporting ATPase n=2 Tax=Mogibacterium timidum TaxID=35519 RepID=X8ITK1_9FIRM|nr:MULTISPECIES: heavy metal translocating P-type ATPase [Mogibacterium]EUC52371.1 heavy metal translocating P-type ATPase [Mogibacterium timidum ATCC 33093]NWO22752.1 heavy metal translocating P-type ATPase [Mogibacterium timidum]
MRFVILHESSSRIRIHLPRYKMTMEQADILEYYLKNKPFVTHATIHDRTGDASIRYRGGTAGRKALLSALRDFSYTDEEAIALVPEHTSRELDHEYQEQMMKMIVLRYASKLFLPPWLRRGITIAKSFKFIKKGVKSLSKGKLEVATLDATAITVSMLREDFRTASSVMFLLNVGDTLGEWTRRKSVTDLASAMSLNITKVWKRTEDVDVLIDVKEVKPGDRIVVRTSNVIPLDGKVIEGSISVNQSTMTGESIPVHKERGGYVYAGTVVEDGNCVIEVAQSAGTGKYDQIVKIIEESEKLKSETEERAFHLADRLVPYSLAGTVITYLLTGNATRALSFLMVDFSCALNLSMPLSMLSAIKESSKYDIAVKGGKFLEAAAIADTIIFDKTGTLTHATPSVVDIVTFGDADQTESLRIAACLEEHYPHSVANAVVAEARNRNISHEEMHSKVEYVVAHGIASTINGSNAIIGSYHFVFEDMKCTVPEGEENKLDSLPTAYSHLYMAIDGVLQAVICIFDPLRDEAADVIKELYDLGVSKVCMLTGDNERTAAAVAEKLDLTEYRSGVLPEDKLAFIKAEHTAGRKVMMIGDGVNDAPALAEADVGIAVNEGAAIAREISDITISSDDLHRIVLLRKLSMQLMNRIDNNYRFIVAFNAALIGLGVSGILTPASSALFHNGSTILSGLYSTTSLLDEVEEEIK